MKNIEKIPKKKKWADKCDNESKKWTKRPKKSKIKKTNPDYPKSY
jgi:hypothetical protein